MRRITILISFFSSNVFVDANSRIIKKKKKERELVDINGFKKKKGEWK